MCIYHYNTLYTIPYRQEMWGHSDSAVLLARLLIALACFIDCAPGISAASADVLEFSWTFRNSPHAELRSAVLTVMVCCIGSSSSASGSSGFAGAPFAGIDGREVRAWLAAMEQRGITITYHYYWYYTSGVAVLLTKLHSLFLLQLLMLVRPMSEMCAHLYYQCC
jgi:hypothetical protein